MQKVTVFYRESMLADLGLTQSTIKALGTMLQREVGELVRLEGDEVHDSQVDFVLISTRDCDLTSAICVDIEILSSEERRASITEEKLRGIKLRIIRRFFPQRSIHRTLITLKWIDAIQV